MAMHAMDYAVARDPGPKAQEPFFWQAANKPVPSPWGEQIHGSYSVVALTYLTACVTDRPQQLPSAGVG